jgi:hypothetical protein
MKGFQQYIAEKLNETGKHAVSVNMFFPIAADTHFQEDIRVILDKLHAGKLHPVQKNMSLKKCIPTEEMVDLQKVMKKAKRGDDPDHPIVVFQSGEDRYLIEGHHRACALLMQHIDRVDVTLLRPDDVARVLPFED